MRKGALVRIALSVEEAQSLEIELGSVVRKLKERTAAAPSPAADSLIDRYLGIIRKVRTARGLNKPDNTRKANTPYVDHFLKAEA